MALGLVVVGVVLDQRGAGSGLPVAVTGTSGARAPWRATDVDPQAYADALVAGTNAARTAAGLDVLVGSSCARDRAVERAQALVGAATLVHAGLAAVLVACAPSTAAAENLSRAAAGPQAVVDAWLDSPGHRANILDRGLDQVGAACVLDAGQVLCSEVFLGP